jgi:hypothetical protein
MRKCYVLFQIIRRTILSLTALFVLVLTANVYFVYVIVEERSPGIQTSNEVVVCIVLQQLMSTGSHCYWFPNRAIINTNVEIL